MILLFPMQMTQYFNGDGDTRAHFVFDLIAPVYGIIDKVTQGDYKKMATLLNKEIPLKGKSILDVGCGAGSWITALSAHMPEKTLGVDFSLKMLEQARKKHPETEFIHQHGENLSAFADNSFDLVTASFVLHGMKTPKREKVLAEMKRIARQNVVIHDFYANHHWVVRMLEFLERSDYIHFQKHFKDEIRPFFPNHRILKADNGNALYVGMNYLEAELSRYQNEICFFSMQSSEY